MSSHEMIIKTPEQQLWQVAFACSDQRSFIEQQLEVQYGELSSTNVVYLNLHERSVHADKEKAYWTLHAESQELARFEGDLLDLLEKVDAGTATSEEIAAFIPKEPENTGAEAVSKRKKALLEHIARTGEDPRGSFYGLVSWDLMYGADPGRITTGRNRNRVKTNGRAGALVAESMFFDQTADTHGGKSRHSGKTAGMYVSASGKRIRKR